MNSDIQLFSYTTLHNAVSFRLEQAGLSRTQARCEAELMIDADQMEVPSHGLIMLPRLLAAIESGVINAQALPIIELEFAALCMKNYGNGLGRVSALDAMNSAIERARNYGVGVCVAKNTTHWGRACTYAEHAAGQGCIAICTTNAIPSMTAGSATNAVLGNNPLAIAVPGNPPIVLDMAMSEAAVGKIATYLREGKDIPKHWGVNEDGEPSAQPEQVLKGAVSPMSGHKGSGLAIMLELLTSALSGGPSSSQLAGQHQAGVDANATKIFIAIDAIRFGSIDDYKARVTTFINYLKGAAPQFLYPGERGHNARQKNTCSVPLHKNIVAALKKASVLL
jgi:LDH2 family malate/lactate/ureidoglycolate dehydrogenase